MRSALVILPLGDSITEGPGSGGYRAVASRALDDDGIAHVFVGRLRDAAGSHEGRRGWSLQAWRPEISDMIVALPTIPDVAWMLLGANDAPSGDVDRMARDAADIIEHLRRWRIAVLVATPIPQPANQATIDRFSTWLRGYVGKLGDPGVRLVDLSSVEASELYDGVHPDPSGHGYEKIGSQFAYETARYLDRGGRYLRGALALLSSVGLALAAVFHFRGRARAR